MNAVVANDRDTTLVRVKNEDKDLLDEIAQGEMRMLIAQFSIIIRSYYDEWKKGRAPKSPPPRPEPEKPKVKADPESNQSVR